MFLLFIANLHAASEASWEGFDKSDSLQFNAQRILKHFLDIDVDFSKASIKAGSFGDVVVDTAHEKICIFFLKYMI